MELAAETPPHEEPIKERQIVLALWMVMFTASSQFLIVSPILPRIGEQLAVAEALLGFLITGYAVAVAIFALLAGPISDRFGRRTILRFGTAFMAAALLLHWFATSFASLLALRILAGATSGFMSGAAVAYIGDVLPYDRRGWALGWVLSGMAFGQIFGIPLGTLLADWGGFQAPFVALGIVMVFAFLGTLRVLVEPTVKRSERLSLSHGLSTYWQLCKRPDTLSANLASLIMMLSVSSYIVYQPTWLERHFDVGPPVIASLFLVGGVGNALVGPMAGRLSDTLGRKAMVVGSGLGLAVCMAVITFIPSLWGIYVLFFVTMALVGARISPLNAWMTALVGAEQRGSLMSLNMAMSQVGMAIGAATTGFLFTRYGYASNSLLAAALSAAAIALLAVMVPEPQGQID